MLKIKCKPLTAIALPPKELVVAINRAPWLLVRALGPMVFCLNPRKNSEPPIVFQKRQLPIFPPLRRIHPHKQNMIIDTQRPS